MRIAVVGPTHPIKGGVSQHTTVLANRLRAAGHDVELVSWLRQYPTRLYPGEQETSASDVDRFEPVRRVLAWNRPDGWVREARRLRDRDLVVFVHITPVLAPALRAMLAAVRGGTARTVVIAHNVVPHEPSPVDVPLVRSVFDAADTVVVHSPQEAERAAEITKTPVRVTELAPFLPVGAAATEVAEGAEPFRRLLFFGLVRPYKGLDVLVRALAAGPADVALRIAGEFWGGPDEIQALSRDLGVADRLEIIPGYVPAPDVPALFADVDALVLPYRTATGSQGPWLGFEFGVPVITTSAGRLADAVRDGVDGLVVPPDDGEALAAAIARLYEPGVAAALRSKVVRVDQDPVWDRYLDAVTAPPADTAAPEATAAGAGAPGERAPQLAYSEIQYKMLDEEKRRRKARKILAVLHTHLGTTDLQGRNALDVGCSAGFIAEELAVDGALTIGSDIDVPGLRKAQARFGDRVHFVCTSGDDMGVPDDSIDVIVFNHIYEHVVDADAVMDEIHRVLKPGGVAYLALGNKFQIMEPHYRLPLLSWLPQRAADRYMKAFGKGDEYYESYLSRRGLMHMLRGFHVWDYTFPVITHPDEFGSGDQVTGPLRHVPPAVVRAAMPIVPTFIWVVSKSGAPPAAAALATGVEHLDLTGTPRAAVPARPTV